MRIKILLLLTLLLCLGLGCLKGTTTDPNTGETSPTLRLDPNTADEGEAIADVAIGVGGIASTFLPWLAPFVTAGVGGLATWRKIRPKLEQATKERDISFKAGATLAEALQELRQKHPQIWDDIKPIIENAAAPASEMENAIRGFRGLPVKEQA